MCPSQTASDRTEMCIRLFIHVITNACKDPNGQLLSNSCYKYKLKPRKITRDHEASKWQNQGQTQCVFLHTNSHAKNQDYLTSFLPAEAAEYPLGQAEVPVCWLGLLSEFPVCRSVLAVFLGSQWGLAGSPVCWWVLAGSPGCVEHERHLLSSAAWGSGGL